MQTLDYQNLGNFILSAGLVVLGSYGSVTRRPQNSVAPSIWHPLFDYTDLLEVESGTVGGLASSTVILAIFSFEYFANSIYGKLLGNYAGSFLPKLVSTLAVSGALSTGIDILARLAHHYQVLDTSRAVKPIRLTLSRNPVFLNRRMLPNVKTGPRPVIEESDQLVNIYFDTVQLLSFFTATCFNYLVVPQLQSTSDVRAAQYCQNIYTGAYIIFQVKNLAQFKLSKSLIPLFLGSVLGGFHYIDTRNNAEHDVSYLKQNYYGISLCGSLIAMCLKDDIEKFHRINPNTEFHFLNGYEDLFNNGFLSYIFVGCLLTLRTFDVSSFNTIWLFPLIVFVTVAVKVLLSSEDPPEAEVSTDGSVLDLSPDVDAVPFVEADFGSDTGFSDSEYDPKMEDSEEEFNDAVIDTEEQPFLAEVKFEEYYERID